MKPSERLVRATGEFFNVLCGEIGDDPTREGLQETPYRIAKMYMELLVPDDVIPTAFTNEERYDQIVLVRHIDFCSLCEHHALPFYGTASIAYIPHKQLLGLSKLARIVDHYASRFQVQERLTDQVADYIMANTMPVGCGVILRAKHLCMAVRGVKKFDHETVTSALRGNFLEPSVKQEFFQMMEVDA